MTRLIYGASLADYSVDGNGRPLTSAVFPVWSSRVGGIQYTDLLDDGGSPVTVVTSDDRGYIEFSAPDGVLGELWLVDIDGRRLAVRPAALADTVAALAVSQTAAASAANLFAAANPETLAVGTVTRNSSGAAVSAALAWPDGATGTYTADATSSGAADAYHVTHVLAGVTTTYTQAAVTRDGSGNLSNRPTIVVS